MNIFPNTITNVKKFSDNSYQKLAQGINILSKGQCRQQQKLKKSYQNTNIRKKPNLPTIPKKITKNQQNQEIQNQNSKIVSSKLSDTIQRISAARQDDLANEKEENQKLNTISLSSCSLTPQQSYQLIIEEQSYLGTNEKEYQININNDKYMKKIQERVKILQEKLIFYQQYNKALLRELCNKDDTINENKTQIDDLKAQLQKKQEIIDQSREKIQYLLIRIEQIQTQKLKCTQSQNILNNKQKEIRDLTKRIEKLTNINKLLQKQLKQSQNQANELEKELKQKTQYKISENNTKLKQSILRLKQNKENQCIRNINDFTYSRKQQENKKNSMPAKMNRSNSLATAKISKKINHGK